MFDAYQMAALIVLVLALVLSGIHVAVALGTVSIIGFYLAYPDLGVVAAFVAISAYEVIRDYALAVIPLFMLMGEFLARSGAAADLFNLVNRAGRWLPARIAIATVLANAIFAFVTGVSIAAAATFSRVAWPQMKRFGYERSFGLGCIAGSACLGMLIPPSVLMIVWAFIMEMSLGDMFIAAILPGAIVVTLFCCHILLVAHFQPHRVGVGPDGHAADAAERALPPVTGFGAYTPPPDTSVRGTVLVLLLVLALLAGIWRGVFTPTEGAGVGVMLALYLAYRRGLGVRDILDVILSVGRSSAPLLLLLVFAQLYTRALSMSGVYGMVETLFLRSGLDAWQILMLMVLFWFLLGCLIDSISIIILTVPVFQPVAVALGFDPIAFAILGILAIEAGMLTPPFGMLVFAVKSAQPDEDVTLVEIFRGTTPYWICLLITIALIAVFPATATWLPSL